MILSGWLLSLKYYLLLLPLGRANVGFGLNGFATKSIDSTEGVLKENLVLLSKLVTAKSPLPIMSMPIITSMLVILALVTLTLEMMVLFGSHISTKY